MHREQNFLCLHLFYALRPATYDLLPDSWYHPAFAEALRRSALWPQERETINHPRRPGFVDGDPPPRHELFISEQTADNSEEKGSLLLSAVCSLTFPRAARKSFPPALPVPVSTLDADFFGVAPGSLVQARLGVLLFVIAFIVFLPPDS